MIEITGSGCAVMCSLVNINTHQVYLNNRAHEEVVVGRGATPHGWPQVAQKSHVCKYVVCMYV